MSLDRWGFPIDPARLLRQDVVRSVAIVRVAKVTRPQRGIGSYNAEQILTGLRSLSEHQKPGETFTRRRIARECGVDKETIRLLERSALRKLRARLDLPAAVLDAVFYRTG